MTTRLRGIGQLLKSVEKQEAPVRNTELQGHHEVQQMHRSGLLIANRAILSNHVWALPSRNLFADALDQINSVDQSEGLEVRGLTLKNHVCPTRVEIQALLTAAINPTR